MTEMDSPVALIVLPEYVHAVHVTLGEIAYLIAVVVWARLLLPRLAWGVEANAEERVMSLLLAALIAPFTPIFVPIVGVLFLLCRPGDWFLRRVIYRGL